MLEAKLTDLLIVIIANAANLLLAGIFLARLNALQGLERLLGIVFVVLGVPLVYLVINNFLLGRDLWTIYLPIPLILFMLMELILDYLISAPWRGSWLIGPYMLVYYVGLFAMIGFSFRVSKLYGFITLITYFLQFGLSMLALKRVGHGG